MHPRRSARPLLTLVLCLSLGGPARGAAATRGLLVLPPREGQESPGALGDRIRGQTIDLAVELLTLPGAPDPLPPPPDLGADDEAVLRWARPLAAERGAEVVLWLTRHRGGIRVTLCDLRAGLVTHRHTAPNPRGGAVARSAAQEEAALLVRSLLRAYPARSEPSPAPAPPPRAAPPPPPPPPPERTALSFQGALGWQLSADGTSPLQQGPSALVGVLVQRRRWSVPIGLLYLGALPAAVRDAYTEVALHRQVLGLSVSYQRLLGRGRRWQLGAGLVGGVALYHRATAALTADYTPTPPRLLAAPLLGPGGAIGWRAAGPLWVALEGAADVVLFPPELTYEVGGGAAPVVRNQLWPVQPRAQLWLRWQPAPR